ncbi:uncharacterized protein CTRU02_211419 [Colletotrichum truncatum]|uniref:Uncharacterized protein n=1 Tax=Colletotrichum truncatum TaxID=5467 RepID=A0ACC3YRV1_COLTU|nr:uncharacterized protein CTRU02_02197 [Colletotrichum truncatum]KAF6799326.1 hypothetical protein CTRU02_02197 [Colletotrichum truncatum]
MHLTAIIALLIPLSIAAPTPKDNKLLPQLSGPNYKSRIGVDTVDPSKLRVDPVRIDLHTREPAMDHDALRPSPYSEAASDLKIDTRDVSAIVELADKARNKQVGGLGPKFIPRWRKTYDAGYDWLNSA